MGFQAADAAVLHLTALGEVPDALVDQIAGVASPDTALRSLSRIAEPYGAARLLALLESDEVLRQRLLIVLGTSQALGDFLAKHPEFLTDLGAG